MKARAALLAAAALLGGCSETADAPNEATAVAANEDAASVNPMAYSSGFKRNMVSRGDLASLNATASDDGAMVYVDADALARAYRRDAKFANQVLWGRRVMVKGVVRSVEPEAGQIFVLLGGAPKRERITVAPSFDIDGEETNARASRVGALLAVSCGDVSMSERDDVFLRDCVGFDPG